MAVVGDGDGEGEEDPGEVSDDGRGEGGAPHLGAEELEVNEDLRELGEVGGGEGNAPEERAVSCGQTLGDGGEMLDEHVVQEVANGEGEEEAIEGNGEGLFRGMNNCFDVKLKAKEKHVVE